MLFRRKSRRARIMESAGRVLPSRRTATSAGRALPSRRTATRVGVATGALALLSAASSGVTTLRQKSS